MNKVTYEPYRFSWDFDSGSLAKVDKQGGRFVMWTRPDCAGTEFETRKFRYWFHFSVEGGKKGDKICFKVCNLNDLQKLYLEDMRPVWRAGPSSPKWSRSQTPVTCHTPEKDQLNVTFTHTFTGDNETVYFAFTYPYSYQHLITNIRKWGGQNWQATAVNRKEGMAEDVLAAEGSIPRPKDPTCVEWCVPGEYPGKKRGDKGQKVLPKPPAEFKDLQPSAIDPNEIYFHAETLTHSLDGRPVPLLTITSFRGIEDQREPQAAADVPLPHHPRAHTFPGKKIVMLTGRVHPAETAASHCVHGIVEFLLSRTDPRAARLRDMFVFKVVPMLNPDGVARGHARTDPRGINLNRVYANPDPHLHPTVYATKAIFQLLVQTGGLLYCVDFHAHTKKRFCFTKGNIVDNVPQQVENCLLPKIIALNSPYFSYNACEFYEDGEESELRSETARVGLFASCPTRSVHCYTLECNYNSGEQRACPPAHLPQDDEYEQPLPGAYTMPAFHDVGRAVVISILDIMGWNAHSRVGVQAVEQIRKKMGEDLHSGRNARDGDGKRGKVYRLRRETAKDKRHRSKVTAELMRRLPAIYYVPSLGDDNAMLSEDQLCDEACPSDSGDSGDDTKAETRSIEKKPAQPRPAAKKSTDATQIQCRSRSGDNWRRAMKELDCRTPTSLQAARSARNSNQPEDKDNDAARSGERPRTAGPPVPMSPTTKRGNADTQVIQTMFKAADKGLLQRSPAVKQGRGSVGGRLEDGVVGMSLGNSARLESAEKDRLNSISSPLMDTIMIVSYNGFNGSAPGAMIPNGSISGNYVHSSDQMQSANFQGTPGGSKLKSVKRPCGCGGSCAKCRPEELNPAEPSTSQGAIQSTEDKGSRDATITGLREAIKGALSGFGLPEAGNPIHHPHHHPTKPNYQHPMAPDKSSDAYKVGRLRPKSCVGDGRHGMSEAQFQKFVQTTQEQLQNLTFTWPPPQNAVATVGSGDKTIKNPPQDTVTFAMEPVKQGAQNEVIMDSSHPYWKVALPPLPGNSS